MKRIIWPLANGKVEMTIPAIYEGETEDDAIARVQAEKQADYPGLTPLVVDSSALPDLEKFDAWTAQGGQVAIDSAREADLRPEPLEVDVLRKALLDKSNGLSQADLDQARDDLRQSRGVRAMR